jgi:hypothetical protein
MRARKSIAIAFAAMLALGCFAPAVLAEAKRPSNVTANWHTDDLWFDWMVSIAKGYTTAANVKANNPASQPDTAEGYWLVAERFAWNDPKSAAFGADRYDPSKRPTAENPLGTAGDRGSMNNFNISDLLAEDLAALNRYFASNHATWYLGNEYPEYSGSYGRGVSFTGIGELLARMHAAGGAASSKLDVVVQENSTLVADGPYMLRVLALEGGSTLDMSKLSASELSNVALASLSVEGMATIVFPADASKSQIDAFCKGIDPASLAILKGGQGVDDTGASPVTADDSPLAALFLLSSVSAILLFAMKKKIWQGM